MLQYLKQLPIQLVITILLAFALGLVCDVFYISLFYTISSSFISILLFLLPFMVLSLIFRAILIRKESSILLLLLIFAGVTFSNCLSLLAAYFYAKGFLPFLG